MVERLTTPSYNAISRQSISTVRCKGSANIQGKNNFLSTTKLKTCLPSLKTSFARELRSKVVYKLTCIGFNSTYVGQTVRNLATRVDEHRKGDSTVG